MVSFEELKRCHLLGLGKAREVALLLVVVTPEESPQRELCVTQMRLPGAMVSFELDADDEAARRFVACTRLFTLAESLGAVESLIELPAAAGEGSYALEVQGDSMLPLYRHGDMLVVQPNAVVRKGDRVVVKTTSGEVMAKVLEKRTTTTVDLVSLNPDHPHRRLAASEVEWLARIVWASQ